MLKALFSILITFVSSIALLTSLPGFSQTQAAQKQSLVSQSQAVILQYHHISSDTPATTSTSMEDFLLHMEYLRNNDFQVLPLESVLSNLQNGIALPNKTAVITFDDGYQSVYHAAFPLLKQYNWPFTVFVTTDLISDTSNLYMNWQQVIELSKGGATIANHTQTHPYLVNSFEGETVIDWELRIRNEIIGAEADILQHTGQNHRILAYPYGEYNDALKAILSELNFIGIAQHSGPINAKSDFAALPRFPFSGIYVSMNTFPTKVNSLAFTLREVISPKSIETISPSPAVIFALNLGDYNNNSLTCYHQGKKISITLVTHDNKETAFLKDDSNRVYKVETPLKDQNRRFRYNCTAISNSSSGRYYWHSFPWLNSSVTE